MDWATVWAALANWWPLKTGGATALMECPQLLTTTVNPVVIPASGEITATIELPGSCDLQIDDWTFWSSIATYPDESGFRVSIYYGNDWSINYPATNPVRGELIFGTAQRPGRIGYRPWQIDTYGNRGLLQFNFSNLATITTTVEICLRGHRRGRKQ